MTATSPAARRPIMIYLTAVVGPTLIVLTVGILAARRQYQATEALRSTAHRLQEERIVDEVARDLTLRASHALGDPAFGRIALLTSRCGDSNCRPGTRVRLVSQSGACEMSR